MSATFPSADTVRCAAAPWGNGSSVAVDETVRAVRRSACGRRCSAPSCFAGAVKWPC